MTDAPLLLSISAFAVSIPILAVLYRHLMAIGAVAGIMARLRPTQFPHLTLGSLSIGDRVGAGIAYVLTLTGVVGLLLHIDALVTAAAVVAGVAISVAIWLSQERLAAAEQRAVEEGFADLEGDLDEIGRQIDAVSRDH